MSETMQMKSIGIKNESHSCSECSLGSLCLPLGMSRDDLGKLENIVDTSKPIQNGVKLFSEGETFKAIYAVKSGMFKTTAVDEQGNENVLGFHLPGELIGLDAIYPESYVSTATAIGTATVCAMKYDQLTSLATQLPTLQNQLLRLLSKEVSFSQSMSLEQTADQKLASFILSLSTRYKQRGYSDTQFNLAMPRQDIANHLGMAAETISRLLKRFQEKDMIHIERRELMITDMEQLKILSGCASTQM